MNASVKMCIPGKVSVLCRFGSASSVGFALLAACLLAASGCSSSSSSSKLEVGPVTFTDANGTAQKALTSLTAGQSTYVDVTLTNDSQVLGADWSVYCGSAPPPGTPLPPGQTQDESCGTFTPVHTMSGPIPSYVTSGSGYVALYTAPAVPPNEGTVTLYAAATSDHSRTSYVTVTIVGLSISVGFAPASPSTLEAGASTQIKAVVNNDALNAGVNWTVICGSSDCGSFNPAKTTSGVVTTYTAPATVPSGGTVQVTATSVTDPTKAISSKITVTAASSTVATGAVHSSQRPVSGAQIALYATATSAPLSPEIGESIRAETPAMENIGSSTDTARNVWISRVNGNGVMEFAGSVLCEGAPKALIRSRSAPEGSHRCRQQLAKMSSSIATRQNT